MRLHNILYHKGVKYFQKIRATYHKYIQATKEEPRFLILISFLLTFLITRLITYDIETGFWDVPFIQSIYVQDTHIHHLVFGILLLLIAGFIRIPQFGSRLVRFSSILYGIGAALTLDEFSLWLKFDPDVYFGKEGRISIDAVILFSGILLSTLWHGAFWKMLFKHTLGLIHIRNKNFLSVGIVLLLLGVGMMTVVGFHRQKPSLKILSVKAATMQSPISTVSATPTLTISPTASPTPAPAIPQGYCLHVPVVYYHHVQPWMDAISHGQTSLTVDNGMFDSQMAYLTSRGYTSITAETLVNAIRTHTNVSANSIVITFDDGYEDNFTYAYPILQKYHLLGNIMVATGLLGGKGNNNYFSWTELSQMVSSGTMTAYDHTWSHFPTGSQGVDKDQFEIMTAKQQLVSNLGRPVDIFAYPYGSGENNPRVWNTLQGDGFIAAFSTLPGTYQCEGNIWRLPRVHIGNAPLSQYGF